MGRNKSKDSELLTTKCIPNLLYGWNAMIACTVHGQWHANVEKGIQSYEQGQWNYL